MVRKDEEVKDQGWPIHQTTIKLTTTTSHTTTKTTHLLQPLGNLMWFFIRHLGCLGRFSLGGLGFIRLKDLGGIAFDIFGLVIHWVGIILSLGLFFGLGRYYRLVFRLFCCFS